MIDIEERLNKYNDWEISFTRVYGEYLEISLSIGDSNCSYAKFYDPSDGHGYTYVDVDDWVYMHRSEEKWHCVPRTMEQLCNLLDEVVATVEPGAPYPSGPCVVCEDETMQQDYKRKPNGVLVSLNQKEWVCDKHYKEHRGDRGI
jgi:hypothetical protein